MVGPGADPSGVVHDGEPVVTMKVDDEVFELRRDGFGGTHYSWMSGPNPGYRFSMSPTPDSAEEHQANIRGFLSIVDPTTGFIEDDFLLVLHR